MWAAEARGCLGLGNVKDTRRTDAGGRIGRPGSTRTAHAGQGVYGACAMLKTIHIY
jgi:hypothetical protein